VNIVWIESTIITAARARRRGEDRLEIRLAEQRHVAAEVLERSARSFTCSGDSSPLT
jgi:hypothetical protein